MNDEERVAFRNWVQDRPPAVQQLIRDWPPGAKVMAAEDVELAVPAPGIVGRVNSYFEDGSLGIIAPVQHMMASPLTGTIIDMGEPIKGQCRPEQLVLLEEDFITRHDVEQALQ